MEEVDQDVKFEAMGVGRLVCCVCDTSLAKFCMNPEYFCSKNCEKLFHVMQGLVLGNVLQSIFRDLSEVKVFQDETGANLNLRAWSHVHIASDWSNKLSENCVNPLPDDCVNPSGQSDQEQEHSIRSGIEVEETKDLMYVDPLCSTLTSYPDSDSASQHSGDFETVQKVVNKRIKTDQHKTHVGVTTRSKSKFSIPGKRTSLQKTAKSRKRQSVGLKNSHFEVKEPVSSFTSRKNAAVLEDSDYQTVADKPDPEQDYVHNTNSAESAPSTSRRVKCKQCEKLISKSYLYVHYRAVHKDNLQDISASLVTCSECGKLFMSKQALNAHKLKRHNHKFTNNCTHCGKSFASRFGLSWHMRQVHKVTLRQCGTCGETFENRRDYKKHRRYQHTSNSHVCHICGKGFKLKNALQAHLDAHAGVKLHFCEICGDGFVRFSSLCQHKNNLHGPKKSELPFKCHLCPSTFRLQAWLDKHIVQKHQSARSEFNADCDLCQDYLKTSVRCPVHGNIVSETFSCPQCDKVFAKDTNLKAHMKQHQEPKFSCDICQKKFTYKCNMLRHRDTHNSEKQFTCNICARQFCSKFLLASHMRMHNQDLLFKCEICGKGLTRKDYLKNHLKKMHPDHVQT